MFSLREGGEREKGAKAFVKLNYRIRYTRLIFGECVRISPDVLKTRKIKLEISVAELEERRKNSSDSVLAKIVSADFSKLCVMSFICLL